LTYQTSVISGSSSENREDDEENDEKNGIDGQVLRDPAEWVGKFKHNSLIGAVDEVITLVDAGFDGGGGHCAIFISHHVRPI